MIDVCNSHHKGRPGERLVAPDAATAAATGGGEDTVYGAQLAERGGRYLDTDVPADKRLVVSDVQHSLSAGSEVDQLIGIVNCGGQRILDEHVLAGPQGSARDLGMTVVVGRNDNGVNVVAGDGVLPLSFKGGAEPRGEGRPGVRVARGDSCNGAALNLIEVSCAGVSHATRADDPETQLFHLVPL